jgi:hypothetical protein
MAVPLAFQSTMPDYFTAIFEGAQGVLLDEWRGFHPYTTWSTVTAHHALAMVEESGADEVCMLGITRAYMTRHGAGPLPTSDFELDAKLADPGNPTNAWQGTIHRGWLDLVLLRYAVASAGGPLDGLVVNNVDDLAKLSPKMCVGYRCDSDSEVETLPVSPIPSLAAQEKLTAMLERATPVYENIAAAELSEALADEIAPLAITGAGPSWQDKALHGLWFRQRTLSETKQDVSRSATPPASPSGDKLQTTPASVRQRNPRWPHDEVPPPHAGRPIPSALSLPDRLSATPPRCSACTTLDSD